MAFDITKFRADPDQALQQALSSRDINEQATSIQQQSSRLRFQGIARAGEAIGQGLERGLVRANDPTEALNKANAIRSSQMQQQDFTQRNLADRAHMTTYRATGDQLRGLAGAPSETPGEEAKRKFIGQYGASMGDWDKLPQTAKDYLTSSFTSQRSTEGGALMNKMRKGETRAAGKYDIPSYVGQSEEEAPDILKAQDASVFQGFEGMPEVRRMMQEKGIKTDLKKGYKARGQDGALAYLEAKDDLPGSLMAAEIEPWLDDGTRRDYQLDDGTWVHANLMEIAAKKQLSPRFVRNNMTNQITRAPRLAITSRDGKEHYNATFNPDTLKNYADTKDKLDRAIAANFLNQPIDKANDGLVKWDQSKTIMNKVMGGSWMASLDPEKQKSARLLMEQIGGAVRNSSPRVGQAAVAQLYGVPVTEEELNAGLDITVAPNTLQNIQASLEQLKQLSPVVRDILEPAPSFQKGKSQNDLIFQNAKDASMVSGNWDGANGPLYGLMAKDVSAPDAAEAWNIMAESKLSSPNFGKVAQTYQVAGIPMEDAKSMALQQMPEFDRMYTAALQSAPNHKWSDAEMDSIASDVAKLVTEKAVKEFKSVQGVSGREALNSVAHRDPDTLSQSAAQEQVDKFIAAKPDIKDQGVVHFELGKDRTIIALNGKASAYKKGDKATTFSLLKGEFPMHMTESFHVASQIAKDLVGLDPKKGFQFNSLNPMKSSGDRVVDNFMSQQVSQDGGSLYLWLKNHWRKDNHTNKDTDASRALYENLVAAAKQSGQSPFDLAKRLTAAAANNEDPVLEATAVFIGEVLSPHKYTLNDLMAMKGSYPTAVVRDAAKAKADEDIAGAESRSFADQNNAITGEVMSVDRNLFNDPMGGRTDLTPEERAALNAGPPYKKGPGFTVGKEELGRLAAEAAQFKRRRESGIDPWTGRPKGEVRGKAATKEDFDRLHKEMEAQRPESRP